MTAFKSDFLNILRERGFIHQCSDFDGLDALAAKGEAIEVGTLMDEPAFPKNVKEIRFKCGHWCAALIILFSR